MITSAAYGLEFQARAITPFYHPSNGAIESHRFLVGTSCFLGGNKIQLLEYQDETRLLECSTVWFHKEEVFGLWSSPSHTEPSLLAVSSPSKCYVFRVPHAVSGELCEVSCFDVMASQVLWDPEGLQNEVKAVVDNSVRVYALHGDKAGKEISTFQVEDCSRINYAALDPHHSSVCVVASEGFGLCVIDTRKKKPISIPNTAALHGFGSARCVDFSACHTNLLLTCGDDGLVLWNDIRMNGSDYVAVEKCHIQAHEHAVHRALFNPFHDELLISCSSDHTLGLWDASKEDTNSESVVCLKRLADFGDSVVDACWSSCSPWVFAGVSYNGKVLVDDVPKEKKMKILLKDG